MYKYDWILRTELSNEYGAREPLLKIAYRICEYA